MKTKTLLYFQYEDAATNYFVGATEYELSNRETVWHLTTIDGEVVSRLKPLSRAECINQANTRIAAFVARMNMMYTE